MTLEELQVYSDMLEDEDKAVGALVALESWLGALGSIRMKIITASNLLTVVDEKKNGENRLVVARMVAHLGSLTAHKDQEVRKRAAGLLEIFAKVASSMAGNQDELSYLPIPDPVRAEIANRSGLFEHRGPPLVVGEVPGKLEDDWARSERGGIFAGSIFADSHGDDEDDL